MLNKLFPKIIDNKYNGHPIAGFAYNIICVILFTVGLGHMLINELNIHNDKWLKFNKNSEVLHYTIEFIHLWGSAELVSALWFIIVAFYYRRLIPLMYLLILIEFTCQMFILDFQSLEILTHTDLFVKYLIEPILILFFYLSLKKTQNN